MKKLRRKQIARQEQANADLEAEYLPEHNRRFARPAARPEDYHRRAPCAAELDKIFRLETERVISDDWVVRYDSQFFQLQPQSRHYAPAKGKVLVCEGREGSLGIEYRGDALRWHEIPAPAKPSVPEAKPTIDRAVVLTPPMGKRKWVPPADHPWRQAAYRGAERRASAGTTAAIRSSLALPSTSP